MIYKKLKMYKIINYQYLIIHLITASQTEIQYDNYYDTIMKTRDISSLHDHEPRLSSTIDNIYAQYPLHHGYR